MAVVVQASVAVCGRQTGMVVNGGLITQAEER